MQPPPSLLVQERQVQLPLLSSTGFVTAFVAGLAGTPQAAQRQKPSAQKIRLSMFMIDLATL
jgi:hypothetical protein